MRGAPLYVVLCLSLLFPGAAAAATAPGAPGEKALWTEADKDGFGTAHGTRSKVWHTLDDGELTEVYYPDIDTPAFRDLQFVVSDGRTFAEREREDARHAIELADRRFADLPPGQHDVALQARQDLRHRVPHPFGAQRADRRRQCSCHHLANEPGGQAAYALRADHQ